MSQSAPAVGRGTANGGLTAFLGGDAITTVSLFVSFVVMCLVFASQSPNFFTLNNFGAIASTLAVVGIVSIGQTMVLVSGGVDISVGSVAALSGVVTSILWLEAGIPLPISTVLGLLSGALVGLFNGAMVTFLKINPLITTLATFSIVRGAAFVLSEGQTNQLAVDWFTYLGRGRIGIFPVSLLVMLALYLFFYLIMRYTDFGRNLYAIGGSPEASRLAGIPVTRHLLVVYALCGFLSALAGILIASQLASSAPRFASGLEFTVIAAVILGGTSLAGGKGTLIGSLIGVILLRTLNNGLNLLEVSSSYQDVAGGLVLILAVGFDQIRLKISAARGRLQR